ncbi:MAG: SPOR domain-containing protein [Treponema sp.]|nr:SPOR domain-containing protein [Treponema sp.]
MGRHGMPACLAVFFLLLFCSTVAAQGRDGASTRRGRAVVVFEQFDDPAVETAGALENIAEAPAPDSLETSPPEETYAPALDTVETPWVPESIAYVPDPGETIAQAEPWDDHMDADFPAVAYTEPVPYYPWANGRPEVSEYVGAEARPAVMDPLTIGRMPAPYEHGTFRVQAASREDPDEALFYRDLILPVDSRVDIERHGEWYRVVVPGLTASEVPEVIRRLGEAGFGSPEYDPIWIRDEGKAARGPAAVLPRGFVPAGHGVYTIQVGAYESVAKARGILDELRSKGIANSMMEERADGRLHRVFIVSVRGPEVGGLLEQLGDAGVGEVWVQGER